MTGAAATVGRPAAAVTVVKAWCWPLAATTDRAMRCNGGGQATGSAYFEPASAVACNPSGAVRVTDCVEARSLDVHGNRSKGRARRDDALGVDEPSCSGKLTARGRVQGSMRLAGVVVAQMNPGPMTMPGDLRAR
jgi:hypothetical protein